MTRLCNCPKSLASAVQLVCSKNRLTEESCKTCGGRFVVDGIGPVSESMLSTVGLEVANSITPELSWKRVTKGRRSRKPVARNVNEFAKLGCRSPKRVGDFSVSDSDKFDDSTGCTEKGDHIPIKKRRHLLQSPSPLPHSSSVNHKESLSAQPRTPSPHTDHLHSDSYTKKRMKGFGGSAAVEFRENVGRVDDGSVPEVTDRKVLNPDDFSGIALLAAAACIDNIDDLTRNDEKERFAEESLPEKSTALDEPNPSSRCSTCIELENPVQKELVKEDVAQCSSADNPIILSQTLHVNGEGGTGRRPDSPKVDRRHWDLNIVMDAWEQPFDDSVEGASLNDVSDHSIKREKLGKEVCEALKSEDNQCDTNNCMPLEETVENESGTLSAPDRDCRKEICTTNLDKYPAESINDISAYAENSNQVVSKNSSNLSSPLPKLHEVSRVSVDELMMPAASGTTSGMQEDAKKLMEILSSDDLKVVSENNALPELLSEGLTLNGINCRVGEVSGKISYVPENSISSTNIVSRVISNTQDHENPGSNSYAVDQSQSSPKYEDLFGEVSGKISCVPENSVSSTNIVSRVISNTQDHENPGSNSYAVDQSQSSPKYEDLFASGVSAVTESRDYLLPKESTLKYVNHYFPNEGAKTNSSLLDSCKKDDGSQSDVPTGSAKIGLSLEECHNSDGSAKIGSSLEECHNSDISQDDRSNTVVSKEMTGLQAGYDSPYEDGEVRVSMSCPWEENEIDDGENECADYESDAREGIDSDGADYHGSEVVEAGSDGSQGIDNRCVVVREGSVSDFNKVGALNSSSRTHYMKDGIKMVDNGGVKVSPCLSGTTVGQFVRNKDIVGRGYAFDHMDIVGMNGSHPEEGGSRATRGKLQSRIEGPSSLDLSERKDTGFLSQSRSCIHSRPGRQISPDKFTGRQRSNFLGRGGNGVDEQWGYWDSRNRFPSSYHGPGGQGYPKTRRSIIADSADKFGGLNSQDHRQATNYSSKGIHRALARRSTFDRDDYYSIHRRIPAARDMTTHRSRVGSGNYLQGIGRDLREDHHDALADHRATSSGRMPHYLSRRERSFSPSSGRVPLNSILRRKSGSRSRSRSPHAWCLRREGNQGIRRHSRSPDFRSEARVERLRMPQQKLSFPIDYSRRIMSPPRARSSPQRNHRWVDDHDYVDDHARNRRSPASMFRWGQRFDSVSSGRLKSDDFFRHTIRPGRFPLHGGTGSSGRKFGDNHNERNREDRDEIIHRARHSDGSGAANRFRHDADNNFEDEVRNNSDQRHVSRCSREDKRSVKVQG